MFCSGQVYLQPPLYHGRRLQQEVHPFFPDDPLDRPIVLWGIRYPPNNPLCGTIEPRDVIFFGDESVADLEYSIKCQAQPWADVLLDICEAVSLVVPHLP